MPHYKLIYFSCKGRAETARQIFAVAGVDFEDERVTYATWSNNPYRDKVPFGQLPVLEEDGVQIPESYAIQRYLVKKFGLAGKTPMEEALADAYDELHREYFTEIVDYYLSVHGLANGDVEALYKEKVMPLREKFFGHLKKILANVRLKDKLERFQSDSGFLLPSGLCYVDLHIAEFTSQFVDKNPEYLDGIPEIKEYVARVREDPRLKKWLETRPASNY